MLYQIFFSKPTNLFDSENFSILLNEVVKDLFCFSGLSRGFKIRETAGAELRLCFWRMKDDEVLLPETRSESTNFD
jgi:hypothetical protein